MTQQPDPGHFGGKTYNGPGSRVATGICLDGRYILMDDNTTMPIVSMMDINGDDTERSEDCVGVVFQWPDGSYGVQDVREFDADARIKVQS